MNEKTKPAKKTPAAGPKPKAAPPDGKKKALDPKQIVHADFLAAAAPGSSLPAPTMAEIAFAGRSNVGKSSLINTLVERKGLVRTGATPGVTRQINLFEARARDGATFHLIDLPGYGYAKRSKAERTAWGDLIEGYLRGRITLAALVILVDVRRGLEEDDLELIQFVEEARDVQRRPVEIVIVATKADKIGRSASRSATAAMAKSTGRKVIGFSSVTGEGRAELWALLRKVTLGTPEATSVVKDPEPEPA
ncbi:MULTISPECIES: ribosome biogenesis GTP-binding protein YihA/YsxC [Polyangium]|uniref:Probable GTP-binding protein EngB n=2 Tax=Polyangium TaxID=55 RepID=A0A4U1JJK7_9BACT|nr:MULTISPECIES: ribosome biogenesis GTP-binding protein YihA/YsxC [Polyangium]MDI1433883.1 ribosome biogenesis GTP-binding protein YihA/YsxC [Polyangium sorediatum]TKD12692.1 YihA family ribosome biogenesis GTP-binding protein [Polyangium fumosum]